MKPNLVDITPDHISERIASMLENLHVVASVDQMTNPQAQRDWPMIADSYVLGTLADEGINVGPQPVPTKLPPNVLRFAR